ncbi:50S ribosomal protein L32 [Patescibacteria group bacterium]|nr:50S ribosomal protein L32 [Patescibacteria group bacterium]MBU1683411.1 50S ribosomal protein L32 [Patescibacteria group bacterium]MBU1934787.1 50S ribosomal protein L32 [Patescibacteria group bacterium]
MAKRSTPKKQQANSQSSRRYKAFQNKARKRLLNTTSLSKCPKCKEDKLAHTACPTCGTYKGRSVIDKDKEVEKITKVKA